MLLVGGGRECFWRGGEVGNGPPDIFPNTFKYGISYTMSS